MSKELTRDLSKSMLEEQLFTVLKGEHDDIDKIMHLHQEGVDVNCEDDKGFTPLMYAAVNGHVMAVCALREAGADFSRLSPMGYTALMMVVSQKEPLFSQKAHEDMVNALIDGGWNLDKTSDILFVAAQNANAATMDILINRGIDPDLKDREGNSAIFYAIATDNSEALEVLLKRSNHQYCANNSKVTPIKFALANNSHRCVQTYLKKENEILDLGSQERNDRDYTILCDALKHDFVHLAHDMLQAGVSFFATDASNQSFITKLVDRADLSSQKHVRLVNKALTQSLLEIQYQPKNQPVAKWGHIKDLFHDEKIQDILDYDVITSLNRSFIKRDLLQHISDKYDAKNHATTEVEGSSQELNSSQENEDMLGAKRPSNSPSGSTLTRTSTISR